MASYRLAVRRDTAANWTSADPILAQGEFGYEFDTLLLKIGDGTTAWNSLGYYDPNPALGTGGSLVGAFKYDDTTGAPGAGRFTFDNTTPASVTLLDLSVISLNDFVWTGIADRIMPIGAQFVAIQKNDSSRWIHVQIDSAGTDNTTYWTFDVSYVAEGPNGMPLNGKECVIEIVQPQRADIEDLDNVTVTSPTVGQILEWDGAEWVNVDQLANYGNPEVDIHLNTGTALTNEVLQWDGLDYKWTPLPVDTDTDALVDLTDTTISTPVNGEILQYNGSVWVNAAAPVTYGDSDVDTHLNTGTATANQVLSWNGTDYAWTTGGGGGSDVDYVEKQYRYDGALALNTGTARLYVPADSSGLSIAGYLVTASSSGNVTVDVLVNGAVDTTLTIPASATTATTTSATAITAGSYVTINITGIGTGSSDLYLTLTFTRT